MVGVSLHGLVGIDAELQQSALAAHQQQSVEYHSVGVVRQAGDCDRAPESKSQI